jgi:hypothetical protein
MFDKVELIKALKTKELTYSLIMWLNTAIKRDIISPPKAIANSLSFWAAKEWIVEHFYNLPIEGRPDSLDSKEIDPFCYLFISYFTSSFNIEKEPGQRYVPHSRGGGKGCYAENPHIRTKKISTRDKSKACEFKLNYIKGLASELGKQKTDEYIENLIVNPDFKVKIAITTYVMLLINRMKGFDAGSANLVLWREFAWNSNGSPKKGFKLEADEILQDEMFIIEQLKE